jgi:hypothetical protein
MRLNRLLAYGALLATAVTACIKPYDPRVGDADRSLFVISGMVTDQEGYQDVNISVSVDFDEPFYHPATGCTAEIQDDLGNVFPMVEAGDGDYRAWMPQEALAPGISYRLRVVTPAGDEILSDFDRMPSCPEIGPVYYRLEDQETNDPEVVIRGIRFFTDLDATGYDSRYFRWTLEETWEYRMDYIKEWYYDGTFHKLDPPDASTQVCWYTGKVNEIFTVSTINLEENIYREYPLQFVDNTTPKLTQLYSFLLRQYALTEAAYDYWDKLRINSQADGGLYEQQPLPIDGNLHYAHDPDLEVLGFFGAASVKSQRIFVSQAEGLELDPEPLCIGPVPLGPAGWDDFLPYEFPVWFIRIDGTPYTLPNECIDCLLHGGVNVKPDFWPRIYE